MFHGTLVVEPSESNQEDSPADKDGAPETVRAVTSPAVGYDDAGGDAETRANRAELSDITRRLAGWAWF